MAATWRSVPVEVMPRGLRPTKVGSVIRKNVTIGWTMRESVRANLRRLVRRILKRHGYPPDKQEKAITTVLEQAEALSAVWAQAA